MAVSIGHSGQVVITAAAVAHVANWKADIKGGIAKTSGLNEVRTHKGLGNPTITGSIDLEALDEADAATAALRALALDNSSATPTVKLYENDTDYYTGAIVVSNMSISTDDEGMVKASFAFTGTGAWSHS